MDARDARAKKLARGKIIGDADVNLPGLRVKRKTVAAIPTEATISVFRVPGGQREKLKRM